MGTHPAYWAGFIDGEGCIRITKQQRRMRDGHEMSVSHRLVVEVVNVHPGVIIEARDRWGGRIDLRPQTDDRKTSLYHWRIWSRDAEAMLREVAPHMIVKRDEALLAIEFMERGQFRKKGRAIRLTDDILQLRESYKTRIAGMHSRMGPGSINPAYADIQQEVLESYV